MEYENYFKMTVPALSRNESFARAAVAAFVSQLDPTVEELSDIKAAVSEAVTNCVVHAYADSETIGIIEITARLSNNNVYIKIRDKGCGIENIEQAMQPLYSSRPEEERAGLGFAVMESCCDKVKVSSHPGKGTSVVLQTAFKKKAIV